MTLYCFYHEFYFYWTNSQHCQNIFMYELLICCLWKHVWLSLTATMWKLCVYRSVDLAYYLGITDRWVTNTQGSRNETYSYLFICSYTQHATFGYVTFVFSINFFFYGTELNIYFYFDIIFLTRADMISDLSDYYCQNISH